LLFHWLHLPFICSNRNEDSERNDSQYLARRSWGCSPIHDKGMNIFKGPTWRLGKVNKIRNIWRKNNSKHEITKIEVAMRTR
jgi:hypothetical protein